MYSELKDRNISIGTWVQTGDSAVCEIFAEAGFDWVCVDMEHGAVDWEMYASNVRAIKRCKSMPYVRVTEADTISIRKALDCGAMGIIVPMVNDAESAELAVKAAKYPPLGVRGYAFCPANEWGKNFDSYAKSANDEIKVVVMVETKAAVENINEILSVDGLDGILIGPYDLSGSYGIPGQIHDPVIIEAKNIALKACKRHGKMAGQHILDPNKDNIKAAVNEGYEFLALGLDTVFLLKEATRVIGAVNEIIR